MTRRAALLAVAIAACSPASSAPSGAAEASAAPHTTNQLLTGMASLAGLAADPVYLDGWAKRIDNGEAKVDAFIDELLAQPRFAREVMPSLLFGSFVNVRNYYAIPSGFNLKHADDTGIFYLREPCAASEAVSVHPWWALDTTVQICPDSYRPEKWTLKDSEQSYRTKMLLTCDSQVGSPELETKSLCGCGPNLVRCMRDDEQYNDVNKSLMNEVKRTTEYVVQHDLPMASLFTSSSTFRDRNAEYFYVRQKIGAKELADPKHELEALASWPENGKWAPREELAPGQQAGVLTAAQVLHWLPDRRQRQRGFYEIMWCNMRNSFGATTHKVLELNTTGNIAFVHDSWKRLAHTELCTNCHARLDYGFQFFMGYPDSRASTYFTPSLQEQGKGPLYGQNIDDPRGEADRTPLGFAKLATSQPEFTSCMTQHFASYVLGDQATSDDRAAIANAVTTAGTFKAPMKVALELYAKKWKDADAPPPPVAASPPVPMVASGAITVTPALHDKLSKLCNDCHDETTPYSADPDANEKPFDFTGATLPRPLVVAMLDRVAFGMMPKNNPLDEPERAATIEMFVDMLWSDPAARDEARTYFISRRRGLPAQQIDNALDLVDESARARPNLQWGAIERGIWSDQDTVTPGYLTTTGLEAVRACALTDKAKLEQCLERATSLEALSRWPAP